MYLNSAANGPGYMRPVRPLEDPGTGEPLLPPHPYLPVTVHHASRGRPTSNVVFTLVFLFFLFITLITSRRYQNVYYKLFSHQMQFFFFGLASQKSNKITALFCCHLVFRW
jgi:hypothetical protein